MSIKPMDLLSRLLFSLIILSLLLWIVISDWLSDGLTDPVATLQRSPEFPASLLGMEHIYPLVCGKDIERRIASTS